MKDSSQLRIGVLLVIFVWLASAALISSFVDESQRSSFSDMFGVSESLFSGFALIGVAYSIYLQQISMRQSLFEGTFFQLLAIHEEKFLAIDFNHLYLSLEEVLQGDNSESEYSTWYQNQNSSLGHFFRSFYNLLKVIDQAKLPSSTDKRIYSSVLRATLSDPALKLIYINGLSELGREKLKPMLEEYAMLKPLGRQAALDRFFNDNYDDLAF